MNRASLSALTLTSLLLASCSLPPFPPSPWTITPGDFALFIRNEAALMTAYRTRGGTKTSIAGFAVHTTSPPQIWLRTDMVNARTIAEELRHIREKGSWHD